MKGKVDIHRLCDGLSEEFYKDLEMTSQTPEESEPNGQAADLKRIKEITFRKIHGEDEKKVKEIEKPMRRLSHKILIAAALIAVLTTTAFAAGGLDFFHSLFGDSVEQAGDSIQEMAVSAEDKDIRMTAEQLISDGYNTKIIVSLQGLSRDAERWLEDPSLQAEIAAESEEQQEGMGMTGSERLSQFDTKDKFYYCVSYSNDKDYTGKPITLTLNAIASTDKKDESDGAVVQPKLSLVIEQPESMRAQKTIEFSKPEEGSDASYWPVALTVNSISAVFTLQETDIADTPTMDVVLVMKDGTKERVFEEGWITEGAGGGGGVALADDPAALPLASGHTFQRNLETSQIVQTSSFSRILNVDNVDYAIIDGQKYEFK